MDCENLDKKSSKKQTKLAKALLHDLHFDSLFVVAILFTKQTI